MKVDEITSIPKMFLVDCLQNCEGCGGTQSIELRIDPDTDTAKGYCVRCGKHWNVNEKDYHVFQKLIEAEGGQIARDTLLITKHAIFDMLGVKPYPTTYKDEKAAIVAIPGRFVEVVQEASEKYEIIKPVLELVSKLFVVCKNELMKPEPSFNNILPPLTACVNAHIEATLYLQPLEGQESEREAYIASKIKEFADTYKT